MRIINIIRDVQPIRMGVIMAATRAAEDLQKTFGVTSELWFQGHDHGFAFEYVTMVSLKSKSVACLKNMMQKRNLNADNDLIITHSPWGFQTAWGSYLKRKGFKWIFTPHGTLEPWSLSEKWLKKKIYWLLYERRHLVKSDGILTLSTPENASIKKLFPGKNFICIPTGVKTSTLIQHQPQTNPRLFLFMSRLHHKKGIIPLIKAWMGSALHTNKNVKLVIAGPDDGELAAIQHLLEKAINIEYAGAVYGDKKEDLLALSTFMVLPSHSEGFPVSIIEAAEKGLIPVISSGVNFPEILQGNMAVQTGLSREEISKALIFCATLSPGDILDRSSAVQQFVRENYSIQKAAAMQYHSFTTILTGN